MEIFDNEKMEKITLTDEENESHSDQRNCRTCIKEFSNDYEKYYKI